MKPFLVAATLVVLAGNAGAEMLPDGGVSAEEVADALRELGYQATVGTDDVGDPEIKSAADGSKFRVIFYNCTEGRCSSLTFSAGFNLENGLGAAEINAWNEKFRFGRGFLDDEADPYVEYDVDFGRGATREAVENAIERWVSVLPDFKKHIRWDDEPAAQPEPSRSRLPGRSQTRL